MFVNYAGRIEDPQLSKKERNEYIRENFDIPGLRRTGFFIHGEKTFDEIEQRIKTFFGYSDIREFSQRDEAAPGVHLSRI